MLMRDKDYNVCENAINLFSMNTQFNIFRKATMLRLMEKYMVKYKEDGKIPCSLYLSSGQEVATAAISEILLGYQIFAQHRSGDVFLNFGGPAEALRDELLGLSTGCSEGKGGHIGIQWHDDKLDMYGDNLLIGQCVPRAVGAALGNGKKTLCIFGDGAAEEDYVLESLGFAATHKLPIIFVCIDNDLAILTHVIERRTWKIADIAKGFGLKTFELSDDPWTIMKILDNEKDSWPIFLNIQVCRKYWHVGTGIDGPMEWDRYEIVRNQLVESGYAEEVEALEKEVATYLKEVWFGEII